jgi:predicted nucleic acid-binding Zn ribbon protein
MRRLAPRPLSVALERATAAAAPDTLLARVQTAWPEVVGPVVSAAAVPVAERDGVVTVACESAAWAHELELLAPQFLARLRDRFGAPERVPVSRLRLVVGSGPNRP